jgi:hypothetical protein
MRRFYFNLEGGKQVADRNGCLFQDPAEAFKAAKSLARDLAEVRPSLRENTCIMITERDRRDDLYCISIAS